MVEGMQKWMLLKWSCGSGETHKLPLRTIHSPHLQVGGENGLSIFPSDGFTYKYLSHFPIRDNHVEDSTYISFIHTIFEGN